MNSKEIQDRLSAWYTGHFRALPWRQEPTPYRVWISEIMLQQTRIEAVMPYYTRFMEALPDVAALASCDPDKLMKLWEGLGYYSRARNLQKAAQQMVVDYSGSLPGDYDLLLKLPGIGPYTAGAIASIAFHIPVPAVDGNVMRVLARLTGDSTDVLSTAGKKRFTDLAWELVPEDNPGRFNQALMELGETVCLPNTAPSCEACPLKELCVGRAQGRAAELPVRAPKKPRRIENRQVAVVRLVGETPRVLLHRRPSSGLLADLWELPNWLDGEEPSICEQAFSVLTFREQLPDAKHIFSHIEWHMQGRLYDAVCPVLPSGEWVAVSLEELDRDFALPSAFRQYSLLLRQLLKKEI